MPKLKMLINALLVLTILFCCYSIDSSTAYAFNNPKGDGNVIVDPCPPENSGQSGGDVSTITDDHNYTDNWFPKIQFDPANPKELNPNDYITIKIIGGCSPYIWTVSGEGFWFDPDYTVKTIETKGLTVTLYADSSACGSATIEVTGCRGGTPETGDVRCSEGKWVIEAACVNFLPGCGGSCGTGGCEGTIGTRYKYHDQWCYSWGWQGCLSSCYMLGYESDTCEPYGSQCRSEYNACRLRWTERCEWVCSSDLRNNCDF